MSDLLEAVFGKHAKTVEDLKRHVGDDQEKAERAYTAAAGAILRGMEEKSKTQEGAGGLWDLLRKHVEAGNIPAQAPAEQSDQDQYEQAEQSDETEETAQFPRGGGIQVRDLDPKLAGDIMKVIFGDQAPQVQGGFGKVITLDPATSRKIFEKVLPAVLGGVFGAADRDPQDSPQALPRILGGARREMEQQQPKAANVFGAIFDQDHDGDVDLDDLKGLLRKPR